MSDREPWWDPDNASKVAGATYVNAKGHRVQIMVSEDDPRRVIVFIEMSL